MAIEIKNLSYSFEESPLVKDLSFSVEKKSDWISFWK